MYALSTSNCVFIFRLMTHALESPDNHYEAAKALMDNWEFKEYHPNMKIVSMGWDHDYYYFVVV